jgi:4-hydroxy-4-methyl-2-oxoglutarate aldolase
MSGITGIPKEVAETLSKVSTGMVADALAISGIKCAIRGVRPARGFEDAKLIGLAYTALFSPPRPDSPRYNNYRAIRAAAQGSVLVIDGKGLDAHFTGDNQATLAKRQGLAGVVCYGGARDLAGFRALELPLYCTGSSTVDKPADLALTAFGVPVEIAGVAVKPGDIILADEDGVVAIPQESIGTLMDNLKIIFEVEEGMQKAIKSDASLDEISAVIGKKRPKK